MDECQAVGVFSEVGEQLGEMVATVTVLLELERAANDRMRESEPSLEFTGDIWDAIEWFSVQFVEQRFVLKRIDLADSTLHEKENAVLGSPWFVWNLGGERVSKIAFGPGGIRGQTC